MWEKILIGGGVVGAVINLAFNIYNLKESKKVAIRNRAADLKYKEFVSYIQQPIENKLDELEDVIMKIRAAFVAYEPQSIKEKCQEANKIYVNAYGKLELLLQRADAEGNPSHGNWCSEADDINDQVLQAFDVFVTDKYPNEFIRKTGDEKLINSIRLLCSGVRQKLKAESEKIHKG